MSQQGVGQGKIKESNHRCHREVKIKRKESSLKYLKKQTTIRRPKVENCKTRLEQATPKITEENEYFDLVTDAVSLFEQVLAQMELVNNLWQVHVEGGSGNLEVGIANMGGGAVNMGPGYENLGAGGSNLGPRSGNSGQDEANMGAGGANLVVVEQSVNPSDGGGEAKE
ncbi:zinc finger protein [Sesbania bispinosa]|nr:zinc finger protein [Sesbania bispinosa]